MAFLEDAVDVLFSPGSGRAARVAAPTAAVLFLDRKKTVLFFKEVLNSLENLKYLLN